MEPVAVFHGHHDADLRQTARQRGRPLHEIGKGRRAFRQGRRRIEGRQGAPMDRRRRVFRHAEVVAQRGAQRRFITVLDGDGVDNRRPEIALADGKHVGKRLRLGGKVASGALGLLHRLACGFFTLLGTAARFFRLKRSTLGVAHPRCRFVEFCRLQGDLRFFLFCVGERLAFARDFGKLAFELFDALAARLDGADKACAFGAQRRDFLIELVEFLLGRIERNAVFLDTGLSGGLCLRLAFLGTLEFLRFRIEPRDGPLRIFDQVAFAAEILIDLLQARREAGGLLLCARFLGIEVLALDREAMEPGGGFRFLLTQRRQTIGGFGFERCRGGSFARELRDADIRLGELFFRLLERLHGLRPAQVKKDRLGLADLAGEIAVAHGLTRLTLEAGELGFDLRDHVVEAGEVGFRRFQPEFGLMAARVKPCNTCRFFENAAAVDRLR